MNHGRRICLIDDDAAARAALERVFAAEGYDVSAYVGGPAGLAADFRASS